ncbi:hypothetical protein [Marinoscillum sp.]|uniref:hypothetical protein n=1 Tax=Marinoscillum sp. TaxID=2024838 RepID=UPI003BA8CAC4
MKSGYIEITNEIRATLEFHKTRTGVGPQKLLKGKRNIMPDGLSSAIVNNWLNQKALHGKEAYISFILSQWKKLPNKPLDKKPLYSRKGDCEPISEKDLEWLKKVRDMTGVLPSRLFKYAEDVPEHLTPKIVSYWLNVAGYRAKPSDVEWVVKACVDLLERVLKK